MCVLKHLVLVAVVGLACHLAAQDRPDVLSEVKSPEPWTQAPTGFREVPFGATLDEAKAILGPMKCDDRSDWIAGSLQCHTTDRGKAFRVAKEVINTYYFFDNGKFVGVTFQEGMMAALNQFPPPTYYELATAFRQKFGTPSVTRTYRAHGIREEKGNMFNGGRDRKIPYDYTFESVEWTNDQVVVYLVAEENQRLGYGYIETREWQQKNEEASKKRKVNVTPF